MNFKKIDELDSQILVINKAMDKIEDKYEKKGQCAQMRSELWLKYHKRAVAFEAAKYRLIWPESEIEFNESRTGFRIKTDQDIGWLAT